MESVTYGNGDAVEYSYDEFGRGAQEIYKKNGTTVRTITYDYNRLGALATVIDSKTGASEIITNYFHDTFGRSTGMQDTIMTSWADWRNTRNTMEKKTISQNIATTARTRLRKSMPAGERKAIPMINTGV